MIFLAQVNIMPLTELLDPKGKATELALHHLGFKSATNVRIGKHITLEVEAPSLDIAYNELEKMALQLLSNPVIETFEIKLQPANP
jgi:phosphoribosylformylglycinamidine synthase PurS subunit